MRLGFRGTERRGNGMVTKIKKPIVVQGDDDRSKLGLVHIYTGDGKGKTTAALGLASRALGNGYRVYMIQFLKSGFTGEIKSAESFKKDFTIEQYGADAVQNREEIMQNLREQKAKFVFQPDEMEIEAARLAYEKALEILKSKEYELVILDEINCALDKGLLSMEDAGMLLQMHGNVELVFTGRDAPEELFQHADYVSVIQKVKHPWQRGIKARKGIEY